MGKVTVSKKVLLEILRSLHCINENFYFNVTGQHLFISTSNDMACLTYRIDVNNPDGLISCFKAGKELLKFLKNIKGKTIDLNLVDNLLMVNEFVVKVYPVDDVPIVDSDVKTPISLEDFKKIVDLSFACGSYESLQYLLLDPISDKPCVVATDGYRLAISELSISLPSRVYIHRDLFKVLKSLNFEKVYCKLENEKFFIEFSNKFYLGTLVIYQPNISYPNYKLILKDTNCFEHKLIVDREALLNELKKILTLSEKKDYAVVVFTVNQDCLHIENYQNLSSLGYYNNFIPCKSNIDNFKIAFTALYLYEVLEAYTTKEVYLYMNDSESVTLIKGDFDYYLMPFKLD